MEDTNLFLSGRWDIRLRMPRLFLQALLFVACNLLYASPATSQTQERITAIIDANKTYQVIDNFGASDAWSCQFVGRWPDAAKNKIADWLFSLDSLPDGNPAGIGLSLWRFNIGAGSAEQGAASGIQDEWRRAASFHDQQALEGQLWFLRAARKRGVQQFLGFFNSPPVTLTRNGKAYADSGHSNIAPGHYDAFALYAADAINYIDKATGIRLQYVSPVNEPQWNWSDGGQEGSPYSNEEIQQLAKRFNIVFNQKKVTTKLLFTEAGDLKFLAAEGIKTGKDNQAAAFFNPSSPHYIGNLTSIYPAIAAHSYFTTSPFDSSITLRKKIAARVATIKGLKYWQSEYCILGDNAGEIDGNRRDTTITAALYLAKVIHADLVAGNAAAWQWWLAISPYDYKDGLVYIDKKKTGGNFYSSKMLWALGNYSRFIRPGMIRIAADISATNSGLLMSAYKARHADKIIVVIINETNDHKTIRLADPAGSLLAGNVIWNIYTTSATGNLEKHKIPAGDLHLLPKSIVTIETGL